MIKKTVLIPKEDHTNLRKEAADLEVELGILAAFKIRKPLSKEDIKKLHNEK